MNRIVERHLESPAEQLAEGFARHVESWARGSESAPTLRRAAFEMSLATSEGHVCLPLVELAGALAPPLDIESLRASLLASSLVGTPEAPGAKPLILDAQDRLYLHRYFDYERRLAKRLMHAAGAAPVLPDAAARERLNEIFQSNAAGLDGPVDWQKLAAALALRQRFTVISGGPGTGKTSTLVNLLACLIAQDPDCRIALAAPTGKAAARMTQAIRLRAQRLPRAISDRLPAEAFTIHRLLGVIPGLGRFMHDAGHQLAIDVLVVDEASMLDLALATQLFEAVPGTARIILLGDKDQLASVESGAVFSELSADPTLSDACRNALAGLLGLPAEQIAPPDSAQTSVLHDSVVWFTQNFRFAADSGIARLAADVNAARSKEAIARLRGGADASLRWADDAGRVPGEAAWQYLLQGYQPYFEAVRRDPADRGAVAEAFASFRALCALREGPRGVLAVNERVTRHARDNLAALLAARGIDAQSEWYPGRPVMVLRNDYVHKLFNGDIGIALPAVADDSSEGLMVYFPDGASGFRAIAPLRLPAHETAFAMTVHKAQGSEFDEVFVLLPEQRSRVLTRELLYTALTRARKRITLCSGAEVLGAAIDCPTRRHGGLLARLRECAVLPPAAISA
ncbi:MAG: exodeoxyribonuclease V subunit alpha [Burkholderiaceae bacterium]